MSKAKPLDWQADNVESMVAALRDHGFCVDVSSTGAGKTFLSCFAARELGFRRVIVICTKSVLEYWWDVAAECGLNNLHTVTNYESVLAATRTMEAYVNEPPEYEETARQKRARVRLSKKWKEGVHPASKKKLRAKHLKLSEMPDDALGGWIRRNQEWAWNLTSEDLIIFDEAHKLGGQTSKYAAFLRACKDQEIPTLCLSATIADTPLRMRALGYRANLFGRSTSKFKAWCLLNGCEYTDYNHIEFSNDASDVARIKNQFSPFLTGINTSEVPDFPLSNIITVSVPVKTNPDDAYEEALRAMEDEAETEAVAAIRARQISEWQKAPWMVDKARDLMAENVSVVVFTSYRETGAKVAKDLKCNFIHGGNKKGEREEFIRRFQANEDHAIVVMVDAGGESISLHDLHGRPRATIVSPNSKATTFIQLLGRVPRAKSRQKSVNQYVVFARGSIVEARIRQRLKGKTGNIRELTDNDLSIMPDEMIKAEKMSCAETPEDPLVEPMATDSSLAKAETKAAHSRCSPSNLKNLDQCPHYRQDKDAEMHPNTLAGLRVHLLCELYFDSEKEVETLEPDEKALYDALEDDDFDRADYAIEYAENVLESLPCAELHSEPRLTTPHPHTWGRCDLVAVYNKRAILFDWKDGFGWQGDAGENLQGHAYALGVMHLFPEVETVDVHFVYTRREEETVARFHRTEHYDGFVDMVTRINRNFDRADSGEALHKAGPACDFCVLRPECPVWQGALAEVVDASPEHIDRRLVPSTWKLSELATEPVEMAKALEILAFFDQYNKKLKELAKSMVEDDDLEIPGYSLVESNSGLSCGDAAGAYDIAVLSAGLPLEDFLDCVGKVSVPKLAKLMAAWNAALFKSKAEAERQYRERFMEEGVASPGTEYSYLKKGK